MEDELWQAFVQITGAANALLLGLVLIFSPRLHRTRSRHKLGLAFIVYSYLLFSFTAIDNFWIPAVWEVWLFDYVLVLFVSALFLDYMSGALGRVSISRLIYLPPALFLVLAPFLGAEFIAGPAIKFVVPLQIAYSCVTTWVYMTSSRRLAGRPHHLYVLLIGLWTLHAFQLTRMLLPGVSWLFDAVPLAGAALMLTLTVLVLTDSRTIRSFSQIVPATESTALSKDEIDLYMKTERPYLDPRLTVKQLATALDMTPRDLSQLLSRLDSGNFYNFINHYRTEDAQRLLTDPAERRTSIEAIGLMAGFRARSTFYEAFRRATGKTPAQFRADLIESSE